MAESFDKKVISSKGNKREVVYVGKGPDGRKFSVTKHEVNVFGVWKYTGELNLPVRYSTPSGPLESPQRPIDVRNFGSSRTT